MKLPFIKFFPRDWQADSNLRMCSLEARGLWFEMLCIMAQSPRYGYLVNGDGKTPLPDEALTRLIGCSKDDLYRSRAELTAAGVPSVEAETGAWFNRRMVREDRKRALCSDAGRAGGGNPGLKKKKTRRTEYQKPYSRSHISIKATNKGDLYRSPLPDLLASLPGFPEAWTGFLENRAAKKAPATPRAQGLILERLSERPAQAVAALKTAVIHNWTGIEWSWVDGRKPVAGRTDQVAASEWQRDKKLVAEAIRDCAEADIPRVMSACRNKFKDVPRSADGRDCVTEGIEWGKEMRRK